MQIILNISKYNISTTTKNVILSNHMGCISNALNVLNNNLNKGIIMRFNRYLIIMKWTI